MKRISLFIFFLFMLSTTVYAVDGQNDTIYEEIYDYSNVDNIYENIPESIINIGITEKIDFSNLKDKNTVTLIISEVFNLFIKYLRENITFFFSLLGIIILCSVLKAVWESFTSNGNEYIYKYISLICISALIYSFLTPVFDESANYLKDTNVFMTLMLPIMSALGVAGGNAAAVIVENLQVISVVNFFDVLIANYLMPLLKICFAMSLTSVICNVNISGINKFIKTSIISISVFALTLLTAIFYFQNSLATAADTLSMRGVRFAAGTFIPLIGSLVGEASKTVIGSIMYIKSTVGIFIIVILIFLTLIPVLKIVVKKTVLYICKIVCDILGLDTEGIFIKEINDLLNILMIFLIMSGIYFIISITVFIKTAVSV